jgi:hypothetical protein
MNVTDLVIAYHRTATGRVEAVEMAAIDRTHAVQFFPHEWSLDPNKFAAPGDPVAAQRRLLRVPGLDSQAIVSPRDPERRVVGVCRHFATLFVALMRQKGVPARARCGFANYFAPGKHVDHWVGDYWNAMEERWMLVDAQIDDRQRELFRVTLDRLDVPRDRFLVAGEQLARPMAHQLGLVVDRARRHWEAEEDIDRILGDYALLPSPPAIGRASPEPQRSFSAH